MRKFLFTLVISILIGHLYSQTLMSITVISPNPIVGIGATLRLKAIGTYSNNTYQDISTQVTWSSSNSMVIQVSNTMGAEGVTTALGAGSSTINAVLSSITGSIALNATADADGDGVVETMDNCKYVSNSNQSDNDGDQIGDACDCADNTSYPTQHTCTSIIIESFPPNVFTSGLNPTFYAIHTALNTHQPMPNYQWYKNGNPVGTNSYTYIDNALIGGDNINCVITNGVTCVSNGTLTSNTITVPSLGRVGVGTVSPSTELDVEGGIRTRHSGTYLATGLNAGSNTVVINIPQLPLGWDYTNTVVLLSNADGEPWVLKQAHLSNTTSIKAIFEIVSAGIVRINWVIFKL
jgi:hypothetical protein